LHFIFSHKTELSAQPTNCDLNCIWVWHKL